MVFHLIRICKDRKIHTILCTLLLSAFTTKTPVLINRWLLQARHSIEDWFLLDAKGIITFLRLPKKTKIAGGNGYEKLKRLFKQANKMYYKGMKSNGMVERLDIEKIVQNVYDELYQLYRELGVEE